jgi:hypothetical protein
MNRWSVPGLDDLAPADSLLPTTALIPPPNQNCAAVKSAFSHVHLRLQHENLTTTIVDPI